MKLNDLIDLVLEEYMPPYAPQNKYSFSVNFSGYVPLKQNPMEQKPIILKKKRKLKKRR
jgi:hypothetical protein